MIVHGAKFINQTPEEGRPHVFGFNFPRIGSDPVFQVWNDGSGSDVRVDVRPDGSTLAGTLAWGGGQPLPSSNIVLRSDGEHGNEAHTENYLTEEDAAPSPHGNEHHAVQFASEAFATQQVQSHASDSSNPHGVDKGQVGLGSVENYQVASQAEAEAGTSNSRYMTPLRTKQAIEEIAGEGSGGDASTLEGQDGAFYLARSNHTGTEPLAAIPNLPADRITSGRFPKVRQHSATAYLDGTERTFSGEVRATGDIIAFYSSDARIKTAFSAIERPMGRLHSVEGISHDWNEHAHEYLRERGRSYGVLAQDVEVEFPELVEERPGGTLAVDYQGLVPVLVEAVKELDLRLREVEQ